MVRGNVHRMPELYLARNTKPSIATGGWHPHQILATEPAALFRQYTAYREILLEHLAADACCRATYAPEQMQRIVDLAHLEYLAPMLSRPIMDYLIEQSMRSDMTSAADHRRGSADLRPSRRPRSGRLEKAPSSDESVDVRTELCIRIL